MFGISKKISSSVLLYPFFTCLLRGSSKWSIFLQFEVVPPPPPPRRLPVSASCIQEALTLIFTRVGRSLFVNLISLYTLPLSIGMLQFPLGLMMPDKRFSLFHSFWSPKLTDV